MILDAAATSTLISLYCGIVLRVRMDCAMLRVHSSNATMVTAQPNQTKQTSETSGLLFVYNMILH
jgi:hypothetical protein